MTCFGILHVYAHVYIHTCIRYCILASQALIIGTLLLYKCASLSPAGGPGAARRGATTAAVGPGVARRGAWGEAPAPPWATAVADEGPRGAGGGREIGRGTHANTRQSPRRLDQNRPYYTKLQHTKQSLANADQTKPQKTTQSHQRQYGNPEDLTKTQQTRQDQEILDKDP